MKKIFTILLLSITSVAWSQKYQTSNKIQVDSNDKRVYFKGNELKINPFGLVFGILNASYEKTLNQESALGSAISIGFANSAIKMPNKKGVTHDLKIKTAFYLAPYYRYYCGKYINTGFFVEGFMLYNYSKILQNSNHYVYIYEKNYSYASFAAGVGLGWKIVTKKGLNFEVNFGFGRTLIENEDKELARNNIDIDAPVIFKGGLTIGYRF